jgi:hypothetical protein
LDRAALLTVSLLLPALSGCITTQPGEIARNRGPSRQVMPTIEVARADQSDEPPLAHILVASRPRDDAKQLAILQARAESPLRDGERSQIVTADEAATELTGGGMTIEPKHNESPLIAALRCYMNKSPEQAARTLESMDQADREVLTALLPLAVRLGDGALKSADPQDLAAVVADVQAVVGPLRERAALVVPKLCFCRPVAAPPRFGKYDLLEENHLFRPGEVVGLYFEVRNFTSAPHGIDYRTQVQTAVEIHDDRGETVWRCDPPPRSEPTLSPQQDYCHVGRFALPAAMPAGAYTLWLKVTDVPTGRTTRRALDFRVTTVKDVRSGGNSE